MKIVKNRSNLISETQCVINKNADYGLGFSVKNDIFKLELCYVILLKL